VPKGLGNLLNKFGILPEKFRLDLHTNNLNEEDGKAHPPDVSRQSVLVNPHPPERASASYLDLTVTRSVSPKTPIVLQVFFLTSFSQVYVDASDDIPVPPWPRCYNLHTHATAAAAASEKRSTVAVPIFPVGKSAVRRNRRGKNTFRG